MVAAPRVTLAENGPLIVENPPRLSRAYEVETDGKPKVALCRCGASSTKPFCDGSHYDAKWSDDVAAE